MVRSRIAPTDGSQAAGADPPTGNDRSLDISLGFEDRNAEVLKEIILVKPDNARDRTNSSKTAKSKGRRKTSSSRNLAWSNQGGNNQENDANGENPAEENTS